MEAAGFSETLLYFYHMTLCHMPCYSNRQNFHDKPFDVQVLELVRD